MESVLETASLQPDSPLGSHSLTPFCFSLVFPLLHCVSLSPLHAPPAHTYTVFTPGSLTVCCPTIADCEIHISVFLFIKLVFCSSIVHSFCVFLLSFSVNICEVYSTCYQLHTYMVLESLWFHSWIDLYSEKESLFCKWSQSNCLFWISVLCTVLRTTTSLIPILKCCHRLTV